MKIVELKYSRRYNIGNYEHEDYTIGAAVEDGEDAVAIIGSLKLAVATAHAGETISKKVKEEVIDEPKKQEEVIENGEEKVEETRTPKKRGRPKKVVQEKHDDHEEESQIEDDSDEAEESPKEKSKKFVKKLETYRRENETHRQIFSQILGKVAPDWKKSFESKAHARKVSEKMQGEEFLDDEGEVLESFQAKVKKLMN